MKTVTVAQLNIGHYPGFFVSFTPGLHLALCRRESCSYGACIAPRKATMFPP